jgi:hypothetical protein
MSKSTNTVVYFDWKMVIYIYVCRKCRTQFMLPMEKSVTFTGACANEIIPNELALLLTKQEKEVMLEFVIQCIHVLNFHLNWKLCGEQYNLSWNIKPCHAVLFGGGRQLVKLQVKACHLASMKYLEYEWTGNDHVFSEWVSDCYFMPNEQYTLYNGEYNLQSMKWWWWSVPEMRAFWLARKFFFGPVKY